MKHTVWANVVEAPGYIVSIDGAVRSLDKMVPTRSKHGTASKRMVPGRLLKQALQTMDYLVVNLYGTKLVHRLVAKAFIPNKYNKLEVNHKNFIVGDNKVENLEWVTSSENTQHAYDNGKRFGFQKKPIGQYKDGECIAIFGGAEEASIATSVGYKNIIKCANTGGTGGGYKWNYIKKGK